jgi:hypothetical protein
MAPPGAPSHIFQISKGRLWKEEDGWEMRFDYDMGNYREWCEVESAIVIPSPRPEAGFGTITWWS